MRDRLNKEIFKITMKVYLFAYPWKSGKFAKLRTSFSRPEDVTLNFHSKLLF